MQTSSIFDIFSFNGSRKQTEQFEPFSHFIPCFYARIYSKERKLAKMFYGFDDCDEKERENIQLNIHRNIFRACWVNTLENEMSMNFIRFNLN